MKKGNNLPKELNILGSIYKIEYVDKPSEVDHHKRHSYWGQVDFWAHSIRVYVGDKKDPMKQFADKEIWRTIIHEVLHAICFELHIDELQYNKDGTNKKVVERNIDLLATGIRSLLFDNDLGFNEVK